MKPCCPQKKPQHSPYRMLIASLWLSTPSEGRAAGEPCLVPRGPVWLSVLVLRNVADRFKFSPFFLPHRLSPPPPPSCPLFPLPSVFSLAHGASFPCVLGDLCLLLIIFGKIICRNQLEHKMKENTGVCFSPISGGTSPLGPPRPILSLRLPGPPRPCRETRPSEPCVTTWLAFTPGVWPFWCSLHFCFILTVSTRSVALDFCALTFCIS